MNNNLIEMKKIAKQLKIIKIARKIIAYNNSIEKPLEETKEKLEKIKSNLQSNQPIDYEQITKTINDANIFKEAIIKTYQEMKKVSSNVDLTLENIQKIFAGKPNEAFKNVIDALKSSKETTEIGEKIWNCFNEISKQLKDYQDEISKMDFSKFKETVDDKESGYMDMAIQPFIELYNQYIKDFKQAQENLNIIIEETKEQLKNLNDTETEIKIKPKKMTKKFTFKKSSKNNSLSKKLIRIAKSIINS